MEEKYYIASPFFDDASKAWVTNREVEFEGFHIPYFSPRQDGVNFHEPTLTKEERSRRIKQIFANNLKGLDSCTKMVANVNQCHGFVDIGTVWEIGYFVAKHNSGVIELLGDTLSVEYIQILINHLGAGELSVSPESRKGRVLLAYENRDRDNLQKSVALNNLKFNEVQSYQMLDNDSISASELYILTDDRPVQLILLMGFLYGSGMRYYTCSFSDYGSNIMIAASSLGHIKLPGINDDTFRTDLK